MKAIPSQFQYYSIFLICGIFLLPKIISEKNPNQRQVEEEPARLQGNQVIIDINHLTYSLANAHDGFNSFIGVRALTLVHLAAHDILNAQLRKYQPYLVNQLPQETFDLVTAISTSTKTILLHIFPIRKDTIVEVCDQWLTDYGDQKGREEGLLAGRFVAEQYISHRAHDGHEKNGAYVPMTKPGDYQYTPGYNWIWKPDFSVARPFTLDSISQFRSPKPPLLSSEKYTASFNEVKILGKKSSTYRSADQTHIGHWWAEFGEHSWNRIGRITAQAEKLPLVETNRMFALLNMNLYDLYLASFDSKYYFDTWRPYTAIIHGDRDQNNNTEGQPDWVPEMVTPPWPEYPSAHAAVGAAGAEIVASVFGRTQVSFTMESVSAPPHARTRSYDDLDQAAQDCANSRIYNGYHFRFATEEGLRQGRDIAKHTLNKFLQPIEQ